MTRVTVFHYSKTNETWLCIFRMQLTSNNFVIIKNIFHVIFYYIILINFWKLFIQVIKSLNHYYSVVFFFSFLFNLYLFFEIIWCIFCIKIAILYNWNFLVRWRYAIVKIMIWIWFFWKLINLFFLSLIYIFVWFN